MSLSRTYINKSKSVSISTDTTVKVNNDVKQAVQCIVESMKAAQMLTGECLFVIDFNEQKLLWKSDGLLYFDENVTANGGCLNPYWNLTSESIRKKLLTISGKLSVAVGEHFTKGEDGLMCTIDYPIIVDGHDFYVTQKSTIMVLPDPDEKKEVYGGLRIITINAVRESLSEEMTCAMVMPDGRISLYDMEKEVFGPPTNDMALSRREKELLLRAKCGTSRDELADKMNISMNTLKKHRQNIFSKLGVHSISQALNTAMKYNLI